MDCWSVVAAPRASWSMITFLFVCALAVDVEASATQTTMNGTILFKPMVVIDPLVLIRLLINCGWFPLVVFRRQDTCGANGAYSSPRSMSQGKTVFLLERRVVPKRLASIADVIIRGCLCAFGDGGIVRGCYLP
jgi:hypothetical protein